MQAVILAAGKGTRMGHITESIPKPMLIVANKNLIEHKLNALPEIIIEVILVIGYQGTVIKDYFGDSYQSPTHIIKITYFEQINLLGTGYALWQIKDILEDHFIVMMGDDIYDPKIISEIVNYPYAMATFAIPGFKNAGDVKKDEDGNLVEIQFHRDTVPERVLSDIGLYSLSKGIFNYELQKMPNKEEYGLPHVITLAAKEIPITVLETKFWIKINSPADLAEAENLLYKNTNQ